MYIWTKKKAAFLRLLVLIGGKKLFLQLLVLLLHLGGFGLLAPFIDIDQPRDFPLFVFDLLIDIGWGWLNVIVIVIVIDIVAVVW